MSDLPGPSTAPSSLPKESENYFRLCQLIVTVCSDLFRDVLSHYIEPDDLRGELDKNKTKLLKSLRVPDHKNLLYPASGSASSPTAKDMDLSLLYTLLRNICGIRNHQTGWGNTPNPGDNSLAACIDRIREQKNSIASHIPVGEINDIQFEDIWKNLQKDIVNIETKLTGGNKHERTVKWLYSCQLRPSNAREYGKEFDSLNVKVDEVTSRLSESKQYNARKSARINTIAMRQSTLKRKIIGSNAAQKARCARLEKQQSSATLEIKDKMIETEQNIVCKVHDMLKETEQHILHMVQGRISGSTLQTEVKLSSLESKMEGGHFVLQERLKERISEMEMKMTESQSGIKEDLKEQMLEMEMQMTERQSEIKQDLQDIKSHVSILAKMTTIKIPSMKEIQQISIVTTDALWVSDTNMIVQIDVTGKIIKTLDDAYVTRSENPVGNHTVSVDGELIFIARYPVGSSQNGIYKMISDGTISLLFQTDLDLQCLHSSHINGDILIGLTDSRGEGFVMRRNKTGRKIQDIERNDEGRRHYGDPRYITENKINGDIVVCDDSKDAFIVVDKSGQHKFDYRGRSDDEPFWPKTVCIDLLGRILVAYSNSYDEDDDDSMFFCISLLNHDGQFILQLLKNSSPIRSMCVDENNKIYVGKDSKIDVLGK